MEEKGLPKHGKRDIDIESGNYVENVGKNYYEIKIEAETVNIGDNLNSSIAEITGEQISLQPQEKQGKLNPFIYLNGRIDDPKLVFGREKEVRRIFELLNIGSSVAIIGEPEIGKSSLLRVIEEQAESELKIPRRPIYLDLGEVYDEDDFYFFLCEEIGIPECKGFRLSRELRKHQLLLILDNVEKMAWEGFTNQIRSQIRALAEGNNAPLRLVIAADKPLNQLFIDGGMVSPFENVCIEESISAWCEERMRGFINYHLQNNAISFTEAEIIRIISETKGHPKKVMNLCYQTYASYLQ